MSTTPPPSRQKLILLRLSADLTIKGRGTRKRFTRRLVENLGDALSATGARFSIEPQWARIFVRSSAENAVDVLARVPGLSSISVVEAKSRASIDEIVRVGTELFADRVQGHTYAVRASRSGDHDFSSQDVRNKLGAALNPGARVRLEDPEIEVEVEIRDRWAYFFSGRTEGLGGLPLGVEGRAVCLLSGGFDSAVAAWLMLKRGVQLDFVCCNLAGEANERAVVAVAKVLADDWSYGARPLLHVVDFGAPLDDLRAHSQPRYWQVVLKRLMYRAAAQIARETGALAIVTGEAIGQVSSQTVANLAAVNGAVDLPVFRPLLGYDKREIIETSRKIGTFELSARVKEYCAIAPGSPVTNATPEAVAAEEARLDLDLLERATASRETIDPGELTTADLVEAYLFTDEIPEDAEVIDIRDEEEWALWHYPGAVRRDYWEMSTRPTGLSEDGKYVIYCDVGMKAAFLAEQMQRSGIEAYAFRGGITALKRLSETRPAPR